MGFHHATAEAASAYVLSYEKPNFERRLEDDVNQLFKINIRYTFFDKRGSKSWKQDAKRQARY